MQFHAVLGFGLALLSMVLYGLYMVPRKHCDISPGLFTFWMGVGILAGSLVIGLALGGVPHATGPQIALIFVSGIIWATGSYCYAAAVQSIGLSRSTPIKNTSAVLGTLIGILILHEFAFNNPLALSLVVLGSLAVMASATLLSKAEAPECDSLACLDRKALLRGVLFSLWAAVAYSIYTIPMKQVYEQGVTPYAFLLYMGVGCFVGMTLLALVTGVRPGKEAICWRERLLAQSAGLMFAVGSICANVAVQKIGVAVTWPLTKNTLVAVLFGVIVLREVDLARHKSRLVIGVSLSVIGCILLALAMLQR